MEAFLLEMQRESPGLDCSSEAIQNGIRSAALYPFLRKQLREDILKGGWKGELGHADAKGCAEIEIINPDTVEKDIPQLTKKLAEMKNRFAENDEL